MEFECEATQSWRQALGCTRPERKGGCEDSIPANRPTNGGLHAAGQHIDKEKVRGLPFKFRVEGLGRDRPQVGEQAAGHSKPHRSERIFPPTSVTLAAHRLNLPKELCMFP